MKSFRIVGLMVLAIAGAVAAIGPDNSGNANAGGPHSIDCEIPNNVVCEVSSPFGIKHVVVKVDFGDLGIINVVDDHFYGCPGSVSVHWDPIVPNATFEVETCDVTGGGGGGLTLAPRGHDYQLGSQMLVATTTSVAGAKNLSLQPARR